VHGACFGTLALWSRYCGRPVRVTREQSSDKTELIHKEGPETDAHDADAVLTKQAAVGNTVPGVQERHLHRHGHAHLPSMVQCRR